jgi:ABC-2 type transport system ATP-binding protein
VIRLEKVRKEFAGRVAVQSLDLEVPAGEIFGLLGHNGAGKSTAIGMMLGQVWPTAGRITICGEDVLAARKRALLQVGAIFEAPVFYDYLSGWTNLQILASYTAPTASNRLKEVVEWVGLTGREHSRVGTYSHGMRARLALAQALLPNPKLLILDEPSDGLDPEGIHEMRHTILRLHRELGLTILLSSHLLNEVEQICTRIAVMNQGVKVFEGTLSQARQPWAWIRIKVDDFSKAAQSLSLAGLISNQRDGAFVQLSEKAETHQLVTLLAAQGFRIHELAIEQETLETFYLDLMKKKDAPSGLQPASSI